MLINYIYGMFTKKSPLAYIPATRMGLNLTISLALFSFAITIPDREKIITEIKTNISSFWYIFIDFTSFF